METFSVKADRRCQRGLHFVYAVPERTDLPRLERALVEAFDDRLLLSEEAWGQRRVRRLVLQFRFEVRLGARHRQISFLFRSTAPAEARAADQARFEITLSALLAEPT